MNASIEHIGKRGLLTVHHFWHPEATSTLTSCPGPCPVLSCPVRVLSRIYFTPPAGTLYSAPEARPREKRRGVHPAAPVADAPDATPPPPPSLRPPCAGTAHTSSRGARTLQIPGGVILEMSPSKAVVVLVIACLRYFLKETLKGRVPGQDRTGQDRTGQDGAGQEGRVEVASGCQKWWTVRRPRFPMCSIDTFMQGQDWAGRGGAGRICFTTTTTTTTTTPPPPRRARASWRERGGKGAARDRGGGARAGRGPLGPGRRRRDPSARVPGMTRGVGQPVIMAYWGKRTFQVQGGQAQAQPP
eukprot:gene25086-biopygen2971